MNINYLGYAVAALLLALHFYHYPPKRMAASLRTWLRRALGMEHFEQMVLDEVRSDRADIQNLRFEADRLDRHTSDTRIKLTAQRDAMSQRLASINVLKREVEELGTLLRQYTDALGPIWGSAQGFQMPLRLLSTGHLKNIRAGCFGTSDIRLFIGRELERRKIDAAWREREKVAPVPTEEPGTADLVKINQPLSVPRATLERVERVLPKWMQDTIRKLRYKHPVGVPRGKRAAFEQQPKWAQELVLDLARRASR